jgi:hypothetical protein
MLSMALREEGIAHIARLTRLKLSGRGPDARLTVRFEGAITKKVVARFLSLADET